MKRIFTNNLDLKPLQFWIAAFYLAGLPRPDIGIGMDKIEVIEEVGVPLNEDKIQALKGYFPKLQKRR